MSIQQAITETETPATASGCFHCGLPVPPGIDLTVTIGGHDQPMCCLGCQAVARAIVESGNDGFYRHRTAKSPTGEELVPDFIRQTRVYDHPEVQKSFVRAAGEHVSEASLIIEGIACAACVWLNEQHIAQLPGVLDVRINYTTHRAQVRWDNTQTKLSDILQAIHRIGYTGHPYDPKRQQQFFESEKRRQLRRIGVAGVLGMQVMMLSFALYAGNWSGMDAAMKTFFHWICLLLTIPVLLYSGAPFFRGAWRDLRNRSAGMDVPVTLGILIAFSGSVHAVVTGAGDVYFDSVVMFIFFLLFSRYFELVSRKRSAERTEQLEQALPTLATRLVASGQESVAAAELQPGDRVLVRPGETVPADGTVESGRSSVNESLLTGESTPLGKSAGDSLIGGSINIESPLTLVVDRTGMDTVLSGITNLLARAQHEKPAITKLADRVAGWFVTAVIAVAIITGLVWWQLSPDHWLPVLVAVLVVTCPCALSLATPTAISAATGALLSRGLLTTRGNGLETLARTSHIVFDKTGTLTLGTPAVTHIRPLSDLDEQAIRALAAALEQHSEHPAGKAIAALSDKDLPEVSESINHPGEGISGHIDGRGWYIGNADFIRRSAGIAFDPGPAPGHVTRVFLASDERLHAVFELQDTLRPSAAAAIRAIRDSGLRVIMMSGDTREAAEHVAAQVGIDEVHADMKPVDKVRRVTELQEQGAIVAMVGDGINDAPVLARADVSIAMHEAAQISQTSADLTLLSDSLAAIADSLEVARGTLRVIRQNLAWAAGYNLVALPAAIAGIIAPWMAAIGMSASSLVVVLNALRLTRSS